MLGASFDAPSENKAFGDAQDFGFTLLSDVDQTIGKAYEVVRGADDKYPTFALRISYLIDPGGVIRQSYAVTDVGGHAQQVLDELEAQGAGS